MAANLTTRLGQLTSSPAGGPYTGSNRIINGDMAIAQRSTSVASVTGGGYTTCDRWQLFQNIATVTIAQVASTLSGCVFSQKYTNTATGSASTTGTLVIAQSIEGFNFADALWGTANAKTIVISFRAKSSLAGTYGVSVRNSAADRYYPVEFTLAANTDTFVSVTIPGDTSGTWIGGTNGVGVTAMICLDAGSSRVGSNTTWQIGPAYSTSNQAHWAASASATFEVSNFKLELGTIATPFVPDDYAVSLDKCKRYYRKIIYAASSWWGAGAAWGTGNAGSGMTWYPTMRSAPTITLPSAINWDNATGGAVASVTTTATIIGLDNFRLNGTAASGWVAGNATLIEFTGNLVMDAEL